MKQTDQWKAEQKVKDLEHGRGKTKKLRAAEEDAKEHRTPTLVKQWHWGSASYLVAETFLQNLLPN